MVTGLWNSISRACGHFAEHGAFRDLLVGGWGCWAGLLAGFEMSRRCMNKTFRVVGTGGMGFC
jgi:hypothetical protein